MTPSNLQLDEFVLESLNVEADIDSPLRKSGRGGVPNIDVDVETVSDTGGLRYLVTLDVRVNPAERDFSEFAYRLDLRLRGYFSFRHEVAEDVADKTVLAHSSPMLYGIARGIVAQTLALAGAGMVVLPSMHPAVAMANRQRDERAARGSHDPSDLNDHGRLDCSEAG